MSAKNVDVVREMFEAFNRNDADGQLAPLSDDYEWRPAYTGGGLVEGRVYRGVDGYQCYLRELEEVWADVRLEIEEMRDLGESVLVLATIHAVGRGSGVEVHQPFGGIWSFVRGKLVKARAYSSRGEALRAATGSSET